MLGPPPEPYVPDPLDNEFFDTLKGVKNEFTRENVGPLEAFVAKHPDYPQGLYMLAQAEACSLTPPDFDKALSDLNKVLTLNDRSERGVKDQEALSIIAKIELSRGDAVTALKTMSSAMMHDLDSSDDIFQLDGIKPQVSAKFCVWSLPDIGALKRVAAHDWRPIAMEGLYYKFFTRFDEAYYPQAEALFEKAIQADPHAAIPVYLLGTTFAKAGFMSLKAMKSDAYRDEQRTRSIQIFTKAIALDPRFSLAYAARAEEHLNLKQDALAISDFSKVLSLSPDNTTAHSDRGLAELELHQYADAISDFDAALDKEKPGNVYVPQLYVNRGDAYLGLRNPRRAIEDYTSSIRARLRTQISLLNLRQFRALYPEYDSLSDDDVLGKIAGQFVYGADTSAFKKMIRDNDGKWAASLVNELYEKRGSVYIGLGDFRRGILDYQRIFKGMPDFASSTERWQPLGEFGHAEQYFLDVKASELSRDKMPLIWVKAESSKAMEVMAFNIDCSGHQMRQSSSTKYDQNKAIIGSTGQGDWFPLTPDTLGEQLWNGVCSNP
jgi:tetratricopeptide (TPR) repeat protein